MNILIIVSFVLSIASSIIILNPRKVAVRIAGINQYDNESVPNEYVVWVYVIASLVLSVSIGLLIFELKDIISPVPTFLQPILEWIQGL